MLGPAEPRALSPRRKAFIDGSASALAVDASAPMTHDRDFARVRFLRVIS